MKFVHKIIIRLENAKKRHGRVQLLSKLLAQMSEFNINKI